MDIPSLTDTYLKTDRLFKHYYPLAHKLLNNVLSLFYKPRETPLADHFVLSACEPGADVAPFTLLDRLQEPAHGLDPLDVAAECLDHMAAGIDTTGDALCFLMWELSQERSMRFQRRLQREVCKLAAETNPGSVTVDGLSLPYLEAVIMEGLRCFPAIPMSLPRYVPEGGRTIDGYYLPAGTIVSCQPYSVHRIDTAVWKDPDTFNPERWLEPEGDAERKRLFFAFASGGRGCVGKQYVS
jgi:cytochrome P450